jgi:cytochrome c-type biogenesis protein CcmH
MKFFPFFNIFFLIITGIIIFIILICTPIKASVDEELKNITSKLRCMSCQNQTIYSSSTKFSLNIKKIIKNKLENNESEKDIINFLVYRYGEYILFEPKMSKQNIFLWFFPFLILAISLVFFIFRIKKNS